MSSNNLQDLHNHQRIEKELGLNTFFFDKVGLYLSLLAVVLIGIDSAAKLLPGGADVQCYIPSNVSAAKSQTDFVNAYCNNQLPNTKFIAFIVFLQSFCTTALYLLWDAYKNYHVYEYAVTEPIYTQATNVSKKAAPHSGRRKGANAKGEEDIEMVERGDSQDAALPDDTTTSSEPPVNKRRKTVTNANGHSLITSYWIKHLFQFAVVATGVILMVWDLDWMPFTFDKTFLCYINFDQTWQLSSVLCDYTSVALSPIFLATYLTISACIVIAGILALCSLQCRMKRVCSIDNDHLISIIAVGDTADRAYKHVQSRLPDDVKWHC